MKIRWYIVVEIVDGDEFLEICTTDMGEAIRRANYLTTRMSDADLKRTRIEVRFADMPEGSDPLKDKFIDDFFKYGYDLIAPHEYYPHITY